MIIYSYIDSNTYPFYVSKRGGAKVQSFGLKPLSDVAAKAAYPFYLPAD